jgi:hypothetical protein
VLDSLNIRKGLELEISIEDIFKINIEPEGEIAALDIYVNGWDDVKYKYKSIDNLITNDVDGIIYNTKKEVFNLSNNLKAFVFDSYMICRGEENEEDLQCDKFTEIEFLNTEIIDYNTYCRNVMSAQYFTGKYREPEFKYKFIGVGDFNMADYSESHNTIVHSNLHMLEMFVYHKNVLSSIGFFISGIFDEDVKRQKEYLTEKEYKSLMRESKKQRRVMEEIIKKMREGDNQNEQEDDI